MGYIALVSLVLGLISIIITIKYVDSYDKLHYILKKKCSKKRSSKFPEILIDIQDTLNLSDNDFITKLSQNKSGIIAIMKSDTKSINNESFENYIPYINSKNRNLNNNNLSHIMSNNKITSKIPKFMTERELAKKGIENQQKYRSFNKYTDVKKSSKNNNFNKRNLCLVHHNNIDFCFSTLEKEYCPGVYGHNIQECKFK